MQEILQWWWALDSHDKFAYMFGIALLGFWIIYYDHQDSKGKK